MQSVETGKHRAAPALQALRTPSTLPSRKAEPALSVPAWGQYPNEKDGATGQREGGSEAEGKSQRRQTSKGLTSRLLEALFSSMPQAKRQTAVAAWNGLTLSSTGVRTGL